MVHLLLIQLPDQTMNRIVPLTEQIVDNYDRFFTSFKFGPFAVRLYMKDSHYIPAPVLDNIRHLERSYKIKIFPKRFTCFLYIDNHIWTWHSTDFENEAIDEYRKALVALKSGETYQFRDIVEKKETLTLSWCLFQWGQ